VLAVVLAHRLGVDAQREAGVGVAELLHHLRGGVADREQDRGKGAAQGVGRESVRQGWRLLLLQECVRALAGAVEDALADVARGLLAAACCAEDEVLGLGLLLGLEGRELVAEGG
jgi:hypothetical protein